MKLLPYLQIFNDRHGKRRCYVRNSVTRKVLPIPEPFGTAEFMMAYEAARIELGLDPPSPRRSIMYRIGEHDHWLIAKTAAGRWRKVQRQNNAVKLRNGKASTR